ncbi:MAG: PAS domain-containing protein [Gemmatimonadales bacterium]
MEFSFDQDAAALGSLLESIPDIVIVVNRDGLLRYLNRVEPGYDKDQVLGTSAETIILPEFRPVFAAALRAVLTHGTTEEYEVPGTTPEGGQAWYRSLMHPFRRGGEIVGAVIVATNVTAIKEAEATIATLRQLLPICAWCSRIQNSEGEWETTTEYLARSPEIRLTHGMCPECYEREAAAAEHLGHQGRSSA